MQGSTLLPAGESRMLTGVGTSVPAAGALAGWRNAVEGEDAKAVVLVVEGRFEKCHCSILYG